MEEGFELKTFGKYGSVIAVLGYFAKGIIPFEYKLFSGEAGKWNL